MIKEIGSIFPLDGATIAKHSSVNPQFGDGKIYYSLCREALYDIAIQPHYIDNKRILIPAFTCQTVITPFVETGWEPIFYPIRRDLRIDILALRSIAEFHNPSLIVVHPYFGMDLNEDEENVLRILKSTGIEIVIDLTQCLFSSQEYSYCDFKVGSIRKWMSIPDGGFLESNSINIPQPKSENDAFVGKTADAMFLRHQYFVTGEVRLKEISIKFNKEANHTVANDIHPHKMSALSHNLLKDEDYANNQAVRLANFVFLHRNIIEGKNLTKMCQNIASVTSAPLYFTIYVHDRSKLQRILAENAIYAPVIWPVENPDVLINNDIKYIYDHLLAIPCDQRYTSEDMAKITLILNNYAQEK